MPEYLISDWRIPPRYAQIIQDGRSLDWVASAEATGFLTPQAARETFDAACQAMLDHAQVRAKTGLALGAIMAPPAPGHPYQRVSQDSEFTEFADHPCEFFLPQWHTAGWRSARLDARVENFPLASRHAPADLLAEFETFHVRVDGGLLAPARGQASSLCIDPSFERAASFSTLEVATAAAESWGLGPNRSYWIVTATCSFTAARPSLAAETAFDPMAAAIGSACEGREIQSALEDRAGREAQAEPTHCAPSQDQTHRRRAI